jgi:hypothetical protein
MQRWLMIFVVLASAVLSGCAAPTFRSEVTAFHEWPAELPEKTFVFDHTAEQQNNLEYRSYENLLRYELSRLGFMEAANQRAARLKVSMSYRVDGRDVRVVEAVNADPFWYGPPYYGPRWRGYYSPFYDPFWYGPPVVQYRDVSFELFKRQLKVTIARAADSKRLYDVTVESEGRNGSLAAVMPYMIRSAFAEFPGPSGIPRRIDLKMTE